MKRGFYFAIINLLVSKLGNMKKTIVISLAVSALFIGSSSIAGAAERIPHHPNERHVLTQEIKEDIRELRDMVHDLRDLLRTVRTIR